ncbi:MAG: hypothetical protein IPI17_15915 [Nitrosomonas sp.]|nr:hypothetical protein [Nitrosomonas sp.]
MDALERGAMGTAETAGLIHHSDRGGQYLSIRYCGTFGAGKYWRFQSCSIGDSYDNALTETINGWYKTEVVRHHGPA